ncbi:MAG: cytochrome c3 family protein [Bryobacteraceae bacterium]
MKTYRHAIALFGIFAVSLLGLWAQQQSKLPPPPEEKLGPPGPEQPIPFSHKVHVGLGIKCTDCHTLKDEEGFAAGFPRESTCMGCHASVKKDSPAIQKLAEYAKARKPVPWVRVYKVPEYVWFSHESHHKEAGIACETCHGKVGERDVLFREVSIRMDACMACHARNDASNDCGFCHNPN